MATEIKTTGLADGINEAKKGAEALLNLFGQNLKVIQEMGDILSKNKGGLNLGNAKDIESLNKAYQESADLVKERQKTDEALIKLGVQTKKLQQEELKILQQEEKLKQAAIKTAKDEKKAEEQNNKVKKKSIDLTDEEIKQSIITRKAAAQRKKDIEVELILEQKSIDTRRELKETISALRKEADKLDLGSDKLKEANDEIEKLDDLLKDQSDQFIKNKINIGNYKESFEDLTDSFEDQKKKLAILTDAYKDSVSQGKKNTKDAKKLKKALDEQRESIKDVEEATKSAEKASKKFGQATKALGIGLLIAVIAKIGEFIGTSRQASLESAKAFANFTQSARVFFAALLKSWEGAKVIFFSITDSLKSAFLSVEIGYKSLLLTIAEGKDVFGDYSDEIATLNKEIKTLNDEQTELSKSGDTLAKGAGIIADAFKGNGEAITTAIDAQQKYLQLQADTEISIERQTRALAGLQERRQILQDISDDDTLGFETRAIAVKKSQEAAVEFATLERNLLITKEKLTIEAVKQDLRIAKVLDENQLKAIQTGEQLNAVLKDRGIAFKINAENETAFTEAFTERVDKGVEVLAFQRDQDEKNRKTFRDDYEQRLDIIEEFAELQFAKNEEIIGNDKRSQEDRLKAFKANQKDSQDLINTSTELTIKQAKASIDINNDLTENEKEIAKAKLDGLDIDKLVAEQDSQEIFNTIRKLDLGEIEEKRLKESIKIRKEQIEANKLIADELAESDQRALELRKDIEAQNKLLQDDTLDSEKKLNEALEELDQDRFDNKVELLRKEIELLDAGSVVRLEKEKELNDLLISEKERKLQKDAELDEEAAEKTKELLEKSAEIAKALSDKLFADTNKNIDEDLKANQEAQSEIRKGIEAGNEDAKRSLAEEEKREDELLAKKEKARQSEIRAKAAIAIFEGYAENGGNIGKTIADTAVLTALIQGLPSFYEGTELVSDGVRGKKVHSGRDGILAMIDEDERIVDPLNNNKMAGLSNDLMGDLGQMYKMGLIDNNNQTVIVSHSDNSGLESEMREVNKSIQSLPNRMPLQSRSYDSEAKAHIDTVEYHNRIEKLTEKSITAWH